MEGEGGGVDDKMWRVSGFSVITTFGDKTQGAGGGGRGAESSYTAVSDDDDINPRNRT